MSDRGETPESRLIAEEAERKLPTREKGDSPEKPEPVPASQQHLPRDLIQ